MTSFPSLTSLEISQRSGDAGASDEGLLGMNIVLLPALTELDLSA